jgi:tetratricopeptide (TPR) repeat protein
MKKVVLTIVAGLAMHATFAQKAELTSAILDFRNGKLDKAKTEIDNASNNDKSAAIAKTWFYRGEIYASLLESPVYKKNARADAAKIAYDAYTKYLAMDPAGEFSKSATEKQKNLYFVIVNQGVTEHNAKEYDKALASFMTAANINPKDTTAYVFAVNTAGVKEDYAKEKEIHRKLIDLKHKPLEHYIRMIYITDAKENNKDGAIKLVQEALTIAPNDKDLLREEARLYIDSGKGKEAISKLENAANAETNPKTKANYYAIMGGIQDKNKNSEAAVAAYKKAVELDPNNYESQYNLGAYYNNKAADIYTKTNKMDYSTYAKSGKKMEDQAKGYIQQSVPYFEAALKLQPTDRATMQTLSQIYVKLGRNADAERLNKQMDATPKK